MEIWQELVELEQEADAFGLTWPDAETILKQIESEVQEIRACLSSTHVDQFALKEEVADLLHASTSLAWFLGLESKSLLDLSCKKFAKRLAMMKKLVIEAGEENMQGKTFEELMALWNKAKQRLI
jgi:uncharacterized protein YabN with tetrapyrrole methylase and pyrophosphatase domain